MKSLMLMLGVWLISLSSYAQSEQQNLPYTLTPEIVQINEQIEIIRTKRDWIQSIPKEDSIAVAEGWFEEAARNLSILASKKRNLIMQETGKRWISKEEYESTPAEKQQTVQQNPNYIIEQ